MKLLQLIIIFFLLVIALGYGMNANTFVFADDDHGDYYHDREHDDDDESPFEEIGEIAGWGTAILMGSAGMLFPIRKTIKILLKHLPSSKNMVIFFSKLFSKQHVFFGILALVAGIAHGIFMFLDEGELELEAFIGMSSILFMLVAALLGGFLIKNKKAKALRKTHISLLVLSSFIAIIHIFIA